MKIYAFVGLGTFGMEMLTNIARYTDTIVAIDSDPLRVERVKDLVGTAYVADVRDEDALRRILPETIDEAIVDLETDFEAALLVTHFLAKAGVPEIIVKADSDDRGEILKVLGATRVVNADREAATRIAPLVLSSSLYNYMPIGGDLVMAEAGIPAGLAGKTLVEADLRRTKGINVVAIRSENSAQYRDFNRDYRLAEDDVLLAAGKEADVFAFAGIAHAGPARKPGGLGEFLRNVFRRGTAGNDKDQDSLRGKA